MSEQTRGEALAKLEAFTAKIGYPDRWRDYSSLVVDTGDLVGNVRRAAPSSSTATSASSAARSTATSGS